MKTDIIVVGGGPAGMMAAIKAAGSGKKVLLIEKNEKLGKKLFITGKGRCNFTNACDTGTLLNNVVTNKKFLFSAFYGMDSQGVLDFFEGLSLMYKIERGNRVFPVSDRSSDVIDALKRELRRTKTEIFLNKRVAGLLIKKRPDGRSFVCGVRLENGETVESEAVILATGGSSYPSTGSDGEALRILNGTGIDIINPEPSLVPLETEGNIAGRLQGLSLRNAGFKVFVNDSKRFESLGELLFTHFGLSGPMALSASCHLKKSDFSGNILSYIDLKPGLSEKQLDQRLLRDFGENKNKQFGNSLSGLLPSKLIPVIVELSGIRHEKPVNEVTKEERKKLLGLLKGFCLRITGTRGFEEAIVTRGGVCVKELDPKTMQSKKIEGLYMAGEMIDVDAYTGGFNLQIAWSTGALAGESAAGRL
ncbi:MAG: NAD(P)/FAD-dependent oxidoreductase [Lachnospiraceae bacterium]|nr:NAD(P)/FAD-dependent oxidoreductase [Lachnospiraceae bacterium]